MQTAPADEMFRENYSAVLRRIESAAARSGRIASEIKLVAVTKTHSPEIIRGALASGASVLGENKVQEAEDKISILGRDAAEWHLIGHLQSNKAKKAVQIFDVIQTVDSTKLAARLERICKDEDRRKLSILVQVDLANESTKSGIDVKDLPKLIDFLSTCEHLSFEGLMIIPPFYEDPEKARPFFAKLRELRDRLAKEGAFSSEAGELSMGMSHDFEIAVEEGATIVRVGTALFGERDYSNET